ncbi:hypothetical protein BJX70DRAFT_395100 [Aspergillus crustosus]
MRTELKPLKVSLEALETRQSRHHQDLNRLFNHVHHLLDDYSRLQIDYRNQAEINERNKFLGQAAQDQKTFVLVLVDGDGYLFHEDLVKKRHDGGKQAARLLRGGIKTIVRELPGGNSFRGEIVVRVYSNILQLSKTMARTGCVGNEARSLSTFAASFTEAEERFDYIDAGEGDGSTAKKIRATFELFSDCTQCSHLVFAGCHDPSYVPMLMPFRGRTDRITLLKAASFHSEFESLDLFVKEIKGVFTSIQLPKDQDTPRFQPPRKICPFYQKGNCWYGHECGDVHPTQTRQQRLSVSSFSNTSTSKSPPSSKNEAAVRYDAHYATCLPSLESCQKLRAIPLNKDAERIDPYEPIPTQAERDAYSQQIRKRKLCNSYYLDGICESVKCPYDHSELNFDPVKMLRYKLRQQKCYHSGGCRALDCLFGHHCQKGGCTTERPCKFNRNEHTLDLQVARWVSFKKRTGPEDLLTNEHASVSTSTGSGDRWLIDLG